MSSQKLLLFIGLFSALAIGLPFLNKPFHIDDTFVLAVAEQIIKDPLRPLEGMISWVGDPRTIFKATTNPPLLSYYLALFMIPFGTAETILHSGMIFFLILLATALVILSQRFAGGSLWPLLFVVFSPAVVVSVNVMRDVPAAALAAMAIALFVMGVDKNKRYWIVSGSVLAGLAILTKYSSAVLVPVMGAYLMQRRRWISLIWLALPLVILGIWCLQNQLVHGQIHLLYLTQKPSFNLSWQSKLIDAVMILGSSLFLAPALVLNLKSIRKNIVLASILIIAVFFLIGIRIQLEKFSIQHFIWLGMGAMLLVWPAARALQDSIHFLFRRAQAEESDTLFLFAWFAAHFLFSLIFVPFQAVRHLISALVPLALLLARGIHPEEKHRNRILTIVLGFCLMVQAMVALLVNSADYEYAGTYRRFAKEISADLPSSKGKAWFSGIWGWQYYAGAAGFTQLWPNGNQPKVGDFIIVPSNVYKDKSVLDVLDRANIIQETLYTSSIPIRTMNPNLPAGFYSSWNNKLPYFFTLEKELEVFRVYRIEDE